MQLLCVLCLWLTHISQNKLMTLIHGWFMDREVPCHVPLVTREQTSCSWYEHRILLKYM